MGPRPMSPQEDTVVSPPTLDLLATLRRSSGAFAMLAVDQREALRAMFAEHQDEPVTDEQLVDFKVEATRVLSPYASGVLVDKQFALDRVIEQQAVHRSCGLIVSADRFVPGNGEFVTDVEIDDTVDPAHYREHGAVAMKLLVIHRPDGAPGPRTEMVEQFVDLCHGAGLAAIIEPLAKAPRDGRAWDWDECVVEAARELGSLGADLYKAEVPRKGQGTRDELRRACERITDAVATPWVCLSSGVPADLFPAAVEAACDAGAEGFLAGRAVWAPVIGSDDLDRDLLADAVPRLQRLCAVVDAARA